MSKSQSMLNNLKSITNNRYDADKAIKYIKTAKATKKTSEKELLENMVIFSLENNPEYKSVKKRVITAADSSQKAKSCVTALRAITGRTEQSILVSMIIYAFEHDSTYNDATAPKEIEQPSL